MSSERLVPAGAVAEHLGVKVAPRQFGVDLRVLNALGDRWINRHALLRYLDANVESTDSDVLRRLRREIAEVTAPKG